MQLLYIANIRFPTEKAHGVQIAKMCEAFSREKVTVTLAVSNRFTKVTQTPSVYYGINPSFSIVRLFSIDTVRFGSLGFFLQTATFLISVCFYVLSHHADLIYTRDPLVVRILHLLRVKNIVWEIHTKNDAARARAAAQYSSLVVAISTGLQEFLEEIGIAPSKILVAHDGADLNEFAQLPDRESARTKLLLPTDAQILGYVGKLTSMGKGKGVEAILCAVAALRQKFPKALCLLVGIEEGERAAIENIAKDAGLDRSGYQLVAHVPRAEVPLYLRACDVLIMNYPNEPHYAHIMSPLKLFEYMASGTPIVTSDLPTIREIVSEESAAFAAPDSLTSLEAALTMTLQDPIAAKRRADTAKQLVTAYTWYSRANIILARAAVLAPL